MSSSLANVCSMRVFCGCVFIVNASLLLLWQTNYNFSSIFRQHTCCGHASLVNMSLLFLFYLSSTRVLWTRVSFITSSLSWHAPKTLQRSALVAQRHTYTFTYSRPPPRAFLESQLGAKVWGCPNQFITMRVMCHLCMRLPLGTEDTILNEDMSFKCICCHIALEQQGAPYYGFYHANGVPVLKSFLQVYTSLKLSSRAELSVAPVIFIHLILVNFDTIASPFSLAHSFLQPYFTSGGIEYCEIAYNIVSDTSSYRKTIRQIIKDLKNLFAWECVVVGTVWMVRSTMLAPQLKIDLKFLEGILSPWQSLLDHADETYLWLLCCGAIVNNSDSFAGLQCAVVQ
ncbi:hypothetical protein BDR06DRAFT_968133 [Suillus hirtellus]|nr:hypothetical protein BDR06DRAFT_968133 [Suillus hirtellus]